jgi:L-aminopeptidase/D-esterase-like protein
MSARAPGRWSSAGKAVSGTHRAACLPISANLGGYTVGVLVQTNFGGVLTIAGAPVGQKLGQYYLRKELQLAGSGKDKADGSCMIVVATDAPLDARNLKRLAARALLGMARTGGSASNGSGDYAIAFSTAPQVRIHANDKALTRNVEVMTNDAMSPLFLAAIEATEEAVYNSMFKATTMTGNGHTIEALPIERTESTWSDQVRNPSRCFRIADKAPGICEPTGRTETIHWKWAPRRLIA